METLGDIFWIRPALLVLGGVLLGQAVVLAEQTGTKLPWVPEGWVYTGGVAGTTFSTTVSAGRSARTGRAA
jgi:hypothetical protein